MTVKKEDLDLVGTACKEKIPSDMLTKIAKLLGYKWKVAGRNELSVTQENTKFNEILPIRYGMLWEEHIWSIYVDFKHTYFGPKKSIILGYIHEEDLPRLGVESICDDKLNLANTRSWKSNCIKGEEFEKNLLNSPKVQKLIKELEEG